MMLNYGFLLVLPSVALAVPALGAGLPEGWQKAPPPPAVRPADLVEPREFPEGPRKVVVATSIFTVFETYRPWLSLEHRLGEVGRRIDEMAADAREKHGRGLDLAVFPELSLNPIGPGDLLDRAVELDGPVRERIGAKAREHNTYVVVSFNMVEDRARRRVSNASVLFDRQGEVAGIYRKVFLSGNNPSSELLEGGKIPGESFPVFDTDFGRMGMMICWDMGFDDVFEAYGAQGAELIVWSSMGPQTFVPRTYARRFGMYIVSATPRDNASIFDPAGRIAASATRTDTDGLGKGSLVTHEIDLDYRLLHWQPGLDDGAAFVKAYGDRAGFHYSSTEDSGIFWSNDPDKPIGEMVKELGLITEKDVRLRSRILRQRALEAGDER